VDLTELNVLLKDVRRLMDAYDVTPAARAISDFTIDQLSNWYVRRNRRRFWKGTMSHDKLAAYQTLHQCLLARRPADVAIRTLHIGTSVSEAHEQLRCRRP
jgi:isoleucyl-tRNA synthetase